MGCDENVWWQCFWSETLYFHWSLPRQPFESLSPVVCIFLHGHFFHLTEMQRDFCQLYRFIPNWDSSLSLSRISSNSCVRIPSKLRNEHLLSSCIFTPLWLSHLWTLNTKKTTFYWCVITYELSWLVPWGKWAVLHYLPVTIPSVSRELKGHHLFNQLSVIAKAPWNNNIFNRLVFLSLRPWDPAPHLQQVCDWEKHWNHIAFWTGSQKRRRFTTTSCSSLSCNIHVHSWYLFSFLPPSLSLIFWYLCC